MLSEFGVAEDLFAELQAVSVLFVLIAALWEETEQMIRQTAAAAQLGSGAQQQQQQHLRGHLSKRIL